MRCGHCSPLHAEVANAAGRGSSGGGVWRQWCWWRGVGVGFVGGVSTGASSSGFGGGDVGSGGVGGSGVGGGGIGLFGGVSEAGEAADPCNFLTSRGFVSVGHICRHILGGIGEIGRFFERAAGAQPPLRLHSNLHNCKELLV